MLGKKWMLVFTVICTVFAITACSKPEEKVTGIKIGVSVYDTHDAYLSALMSAFNSYITSKAKDTGIAMSVEVQNANGSQATQNSSVEDMINNGCDVLCVNLVDRTDPTVIIDMAEQKNIPVIFFNRELVDGDIERWNRLYYVGADATQSGMMQGEIAINAIKNKDADKNGDGIIQYVMIEGEAGHQDSKVRTESSVVTIKKAGIKVEKVASAIANWDRAQALTKMSAIIDQYGSDIELVLSNNDDMALGVIDAYESAGILMEERPVIIGIDGIDEGLEAVREEKMYGTVYNDKEGQAKTMAELIYSELVSKDFSSIDFSFGRYVRLPYAKVLKSDAEGTKYSR